MNESVLRTTSWGGLDACSGIRIHYDDRHAHAAHCYCLWRLKPGEEARLDRLRAFWPKRCKKASADVQWSVHRDGFRISKSGYMTCGMISNLLDVGRDQRKLMAYYRNVFVVYAALGLAKLLLSPTS